MSAIAALQSPVELVRRVRAEYLEMPGLQLTEGQAQRLFGLSAATCRDVLASLLSSGFLCRSTRTGMLAMATGLRVKEA